MNGERNGGFERIGHRAVFFQRQAGCFFELFLGYVRRVNNVGAMNGGEGAGRGFAALPFGFNAEIEYRFFALF